MRDIAKNLWQQPKISLLLFVLSLPFLVQVSYSNAPDCSSEEAALEAAKAAYEAAKEALEAADARFLMSLKGLRHAVDDEESSDRWAKLGLGASFVGVAASGVGAMLMIAYPPAGAAYYLGWGGVAGGGLGSFAGGVASAYGYASTSEAVGRARIDVDYDKAVRKAAKEAEKDAWDALKAAEEALEDCLSDG